MSKPKLTVRTGDTLAAVARLSGSENHKGYNIIHADGYVVAYVIPIDEDGIAGGELARQFAAAPELLAALERIKDRLAPLAVAGGGNSLDDSYDTALAAIAKVRAKEEPTPHFSNEHGDCPSWCSGCQHDPPQQCFFPRCHCVSPSLGDCKGEKHSAPEMEEAAKLRADNERLRVALERLTYLYESEQDTEALERVGRPDWLRAALGEEAPDA